MGLIRSISVLDISNHLEDCTFLGFWPSKRLSLVCQVSCESFYMHSVTLLLEVWYLCCLIHEGFLAPKTIVFETFIN